MASPSSQSWLGNLASIPQRYVRANEQPPPAYRMRKYAIPYWINTELSNSIHDNGCQCTWSIYVCVRFKPVLWHTLSGLLLICLFLSDTYYLLTPSNAEATTWSCILLRYAVGTKKTTQRDFHAQLWPLSKHFESSLEKNLLSHLKLKLCIVLALSCFSLESLPNSVAHSQCDSVYRPF